MKTKGKFLKDFALRGMIAMGFGPIVLAIVYFILGLTGVAENIGVYEMVIGIVTITALAFLCGGMTVVYQIESLGISKAITLHGIILYIGYAMVYLMNGWLKDGLTSFIVFTIIFILGYALVWLFIYLITRSGANRLNSKLKNRAE
ncbi:MAG: DUF3021 domain-containing protein [Clostridia bacterium]|nr:DUF3021 domain-containing protein [Clostridia bacterium]